LKRSVRRERNGWRAYASLGLVLATLAVGGAMAAGAASGSILSVVQATTTEPAATTSTTPSEPPPPPPPKPDPAPPPPPPSPSPSPSPAPTPASAATSPNSAPEPRQKRRRAADRTSENSASFSDPRALALRTRVTSVRENGLGVNSPLTSYASAPASSRETVVLYVLFGLLGLAFVPLALGVTPAPALGAFPDRLLRHRTEFAFLGAAMLLGVAIGFATVLPIR
jgi:outer membrane biosynthesis protein TonB